MKYEIAWVEVKTSAKGTEYKRATIKDEAGATYDNVAVFATFADYVNIQAGRSVDGKLVSKDYQGKPSYTLESDGQKPPQRSAGAITKAMETKAQNIEKAQDNKNLGIKISSTMRDAVLIATTILANSHVESSTGDVKDLILHWRKWLWENFDKEDGDFNPF